MRASVKVLCGVRSKIKLHIAKLLTHGNLTVGLDICFANISENPYIRANIIILWNRLDASVYENIYSSFSTVDWGGRRTFVIELGYFYGYCDNRKLARTGYNARAIKMTPHSNWHTDGSYTIKMMLECGLHIGTKNKVELGICSSNFRTEVVMVVMLFQTSLVYQESKRRLNSIQTS